MFFYFEFLLFLLKSSKTYILFGDDGRDGALQVARSRDGTPLAKGRLKDQGQQSSVAACYSGGAPHHGNHQDGTIRNCLKFETWYHIWFQMLYIYNFKYIIVSKWNLFKCLNYPFKLLTVCFFETFNLCFLKPLPFLRISPFVGSISLFLFSNILFISVLYLMFVPFSISILLSISILFYSPSLPLSLFPLSLFFPFLCPFGPLFGSASPPPRGFGTSGSARGRQRCQEHNLRNHMRGTAFCKDIPKTCKICKCRAFFQIPVIYIDLQSAHLDGFLGSTKTKECQCDEKY